MNNFSAVRIDDRLIHGQIVATWISALGVKSIIVADDKAANDALQKTLLKMAVPASIKFDILPIEQAASMSKDDCTDMSKTLLIVRDISAVKTLMELGVKFDAINFGNAAIAAGRVQYSKSVWMTPEERVLAEQVMADGVKLEVRVVPSEKATNLKDLLK